MKGLTGFWRSLWDSLGEFIRRPMAHHLGVKRWTLMGATGLLALLFLGGGAVALAGLVSGVGVTVSSNPKFCDSCHEIVPAYEQWRISSHKSVNCLTCHTDEGLPGYTKINVEGLRNILTHASGLTQLPPEASVKNDSCLQCHPRADLPEAIPQATLRISHTPHQDLDCPACHVRLVHPLLFDSQPMAQATTPAQKDCSVCHASPKPEYLHGDADVACSSCHSGNIPNHDLAVRRNTPLRESCVECHPQQRVSQPESCQTCHVSPHGVSQNCGQCHSSTDSWAPRTFSHPAALTGAHERFQCAQCHVPAQTPSGQTVSSGNYLCSTCHTPKHPPMDNNCTKCHTTAAWKPLKGQSQ